MNTEHFQDPLFAQCYQRWQAQPESAAFVGVADILRVRGAYQEAVTVCREGLRHNPQLVTGRLVLAKCLEALDRRTDAHALVLSILADVPAQSEAKTMAERLNPNPVAKLAPEVVPSKSAPAPMIAAAPSPVPAEKPLRRMPAPEPAPEPEPMDMHGDASDAEASEDHPMFLTTVTMARLYASQGHRREAARVCRAILQRNPDNAEAQAELEKLEA